MAKRASGGGGASAQAIGTAVAVIGKVVGALAEIPKAVEGFVAAFNPGAVETMNEAFRGLQATLGYALEPVVQGLTDLFRTLAGELVGVVTEVRPVVSEVVGVFLNLLAPVIQLVGTQLRNLADLLKALMPIVRLLSKFIEGNLTLFSVLAQILNTVVIDTLSALAESFGGLDGATKGVGDAFVGLTVGIIKFTVFVLRLIGQTGLALKVLENLARKPRQGGIAAAPTNFAVGDLSDVYKKRLVEAARAQGGPQVTRSESLLERIAKAAEEQLKELRKDKEKQEQATPQSRWAERRELFRGNPGLIGAAVNLGLI